MEIRNLPELQLQHLETQEALERVEQYINALRRHLLDTPVVVPQETQSPEGVYGHLIFTGKELKFGFRDPWNPGKVRYVFLASEADKPAPH